MWGSVTEMCRFSFNFLISIERYVYIPTMDIGDFTKNSVFRKVRIELIFDF